MILKCISTSFTLARHLRVSPKLLTCTHKFYPVRFCSNGTSSLDIFNQIFDENEKTKEDYFSLRNRYFHQGTSQKINNMDTLTKNFAPWFKKISIDILV